MLCGGEGVALLKKVAFELALALLVKMMVRLFQAHFE